MKDRQQNSTNHAVPFLMVLASDHITGATGLSPTVTLSKDGAAFGAAAGAVTEIGNGWYLLAGNATDRNTLGELAIHATAATADPSDDKYCIVPWDPFDAHRGTCGDVLPSVASNQANGIPVSTNAGYIPIDWSAIHAPATVVDLSGTTIKNLDGNTVQTGDAYAEAVLIYNRIGAGGASLGAIPDEAGVTTLLSRLTSARAGYIDNLSAGAVAQAATALSNANIPANWLTASGIAAGALDGKGDWLLSSSYTVGPTTAAIAVAVMNDISDSVGADVVAIKAKTDNLPSSPAATGAAMTLTSAALDAILVESGIVAGALLVNDAAGQLTSINARQALALILSALAGKDTGGGTSSVAFQPAGIPSASNPRISTSGADDNGNRGTVTLRVPT
ncbi:MAG TPA: hypothetical protein VND64_19465 [Pirellulales bacterium]|nr:hypothetical protein [Pirellulales bacterium]